MITRDWYHPEATGGDITPWEYARYLAANGHEIVYLTSSFVGAEPEESMDGIRVVRRGGPWTQFWHCFTYYIRNGRGRFDVVVAEGFGGSRIPRFAPLYVKEPIVTLWYQVHDSLFSAQYPSAIVPPLKLLERLTARVHRHTSVCALTEEWERLLPAVGLSRENISVVPVTIRENWLSDSRPRSESAPTIVWIGKFRRYKCPHHLLRAMEKVLARIPNARITFVGRHDDIQYEDELRRMAQKLCILPAVSFQFNISEEEKRKLLMQSRVLVVTSPVEGFGIVVLEANACGGPVVVSSGVPESVVTDGYNGLRYPFGDIEVLATALLEVLEDDKTFARLSRNAVNFAQQFGWRTVGRRFEHVVLNAEQGRSAGQAPR